MPPKVNIVLSKRKEVGSGTAAVVLAQLDPDDGLAVLWAVPFPPPIRPVQVPLVTLAAKSTWLVPFRVSTLIGLLLVSVNASVFPPNPGPPLV